MNTRSFAKILLLSIGILFLSNMGFSRSNETSFLEDANISPSRLEWARDSVFFYIKGSIPIISGFLPRNPKLQLVYKGKNGELDLGEIELKKHVSEYKYDQKIGFRYQEWMEKGVLEARFFHGSKKLSEAQEVKILAKGISTIPLLMWIGLDKSNLSNPQVGWMISKHDQIINTPKIGEFTFGFEVGSAVISRSSANQNSLNALKEFTKKNPLIRSLKITGIQSPELAEGRNSKLGMDRAVAVLESLEAIGLVEDKEKIQLDSRWRDWFDFRVLLNTVPNIASQTKEEYYKVLQNGADFLSQTQDLKKIAGFEEISKQLYPRLRVAKVEIHGSQIWGLDPAKFQKMQEILRNPSEINTIEEQDWEIASQLAPLVEEKELIYRKMLLLFRSAFATNNLAVLMMRQAQQEKDDLEKERLLQEAADLLVEALKIETNPKVLHNQSLILISQGSEWEAYKKLSVASSLSKDIDFLVENENLRGALDVWRGDYKLARIRYEYPSSDPSLLFNKGIAFLLAEDYAKATQAFEESVMANRDFGYGFYGLALVAALSGQEDIAWIHLQKAMSLKADIDHKAKYEPIFESIRRTNSFDF